MFTRYFCRVDAFWNACTKSQVYVASAAADDSDQNNNDDAVTLLSVLLLLLFFTSLMLLKVLQRPQPTWHRMLLAAALSLTIVIASFVRSALFSSLCYLSVPLVVLNFNKACACVLEHYAAAPRERRGAEDAPSQCVKNAGRPS